MMRKWEYTSELPPKPGYKAYKVSLINLESHLTSDLNWDDQTWSTISLSRLSSTHFRKRILPLHVTIPAKCWSAVGDPLPSSLGPSLGHRARGCRGAQAQGESTGAPVLVLWLPSIRANARYLAAPGYHWLFCKMRTSTSLGVLLRRWHDLMNVPCSPQYSNEFL